MKKNGLRYSIAAFSIMATLLASFYACTKTSHLSGSPYPPAPEPIVGFYGKDKVTPTANVGDTVQFRVRGVSKLGSGYTFYINGTPATVTKATDSLVYVVIPQNVSSGPGSIVTSDGQYFYGPEIKIIGNIFIDPDFNRGGITPGSDGPISDLAVATANNRPVYIIAGSFSNYNGQSRKLNNIASLYADDGSFWDVNTHWGANGAIATIFSGKTSGAAKYFLGGAFSNYYSPTIKSLDIASVNPGNLGLDSTTVKVLNSDSVLYPLNSLDTVSAFNGGVADGGSIAIAKIFAGPTDDQAIIIGNFSHYVNYDYSRSAKGQAYPTYYGIRNFARVQVNAGQVGMLDTTYNYSYNRLNGNYDRNLNGNVVDAVQLPDKRIVIVGSFTDLSSPSNAASPALHVPGIMALTTAGQADPAFAANIGAGPNASVFKITYNNTTKKILVTGNFTSFNGQPANGVAMLNPDGTLDNTFKLADYSGGYINYAGQLNNGKIIIAGNFKQYGGLLRQGFAVVDATGALANGYNNMGAFSGRILGMYQRSNNLVLLYGWISRIDNTPVGNIVQLKLTQ
ncbi:MAG: DUF5008 domain-containing protein [Niabella sp.]|nr:DUF5008 domain-containing protein [Niabella sp.]